MTDLTIDGETFRVEVEGAADRPSVLLSSALGSDLTLWDAQMPALLQHFRVVRYDPRGHGRTKALGIPFSIARLGADALAILDALSIETTHFIGMSMGGAVGQWLLAHAPERIARAVVANSGPRLGTPAVWNQRIVSVLSHGMESLAAATMERWFSDRFREAEPDRVAAVEAAFLATSRDGYAACCAALRDMDLREALHAIDRPVLIVTGRDDQATSEADVATMTAAIRDAQHLELDCRHISNIEVEAAFNQAVVEFLTSRTPTRAGRPRPARKHAAPVRRPTTGRATAARRPLAAPAKPPAGKPRTGRPAAAAPGPAAAASGTRRTATKRTQTKAPPKKAAGATSRKTPARKTAAKTNTPKTKTAKTNTAKTNTAETTAVRKAARAPARGATSKKAKPKKTASRKAAASKSVTATRSPRKTATPARRRPGKTTPRRPGGPRKR